MKDTNREEIKTSLELSEDTDKADEVVRKIVGDDASLKEKISFLSDLFGIEVVEQPEVDDDVTYYNAMLLSIVNAKYE